MKTEFAVTVDLIVEFAEIIAENQLTNEILGTTDDNELLIEVEFDKSEFDVVEQLEELLNSYDEDGDDD